MLKLFRLSDGSYQDEDGRLYDYDDGMFINQDDYMDTWDEKNVTIANSSNNSGGSNFQSLNADIQAGVQTGGMLLNMFGGYFGLQPNSNLQQNQTQDAFTQRQQELARQRAEQEALRNKNKNNQGSSNMLLYGGIALGLVVVVGVVVYAVSGSSDNDKK